MYVDYGTSIEIPTGYQKYFRDKYYSFDELLGLIIELKDEITELENKLEEVVE